MDKRVKLVKKYSKIIESRLDTVSYEKLKELLTVCFVNRLLLVLSITEEAQEASRHLKKLQDAIIAEMGKRKAGAKRKRVRK